VRTCAKLAEEPIEARSAIDLVRLPIPCVDDVVVFATEHIVLTPPAEELVSAFVAVYLVGVVLTAHGFGPAEAISASSLSRPRILSDRP
jgi:hypothetical protein